MQIETNTKVARDWIALMGDCLMETFHLAAETAPFLFVGFLLAGVLKVLVPTRWIQGQLGGEGVASISKAALLGVPLPLCSCSVIPTAASLRAAGAGRGPTTAFLISTPETGVDSISVTWALLDPLMTVIRPVVSFLTALITGVLVALFGGAEPSAKSIQADADGCCAHKEPVAPAATSCCDAKPVSKWREVLRYGFVTLVDDLAKWLLIGFLLSGMVAALVPASFFTDTVPDGLLGMLLMILVGTPLYICATASTPIAATLVAKGLAPGAALVFLLVGPATNATTLLVVARMIGRRAVVLYLFGIVIVALAAGYATNALYSALDINLAAIVSQGMQHHPSAFAQVAGAALILMLVLSLVRTMRAPAHKH
jgi:uncharacterized protein